MRKSIYITCLVIFNMSIGLYGQMAVTDPGATLVARENALINKTTLTKSISMLKNLDDMKKKYQEWSDNIEVVNNAVATSKQAVNIGKLMDQIGDVYSESMKFINNEKLLGAKDKSKIAYVFTSVLTDALSDLDTSMSITGDGFFKMNDSERLNTLMKVEKDMKTHYDLMLYMQKKLAFGISKAQKNYVGNSIISDAQSEITE